MTTIEFKSRLVSMEGNLRNYARTLTRNEEDANDLVQETFLKVLENQEKFDTDTNLKAWTYTIMKNTFINAYRRSKRSNELVDTSEEVYLNNLNAPDEAEKPDNALRAGEIRSAIKKLSPEHRESFQLFNDGYKYKEIADMLGLSIGTVKSRIFFGRKRLMDDLKGYAS